MELPADYSVKLFRKIEVTNKAAFLFFIGRRPYYSLRLNQEQSYHVRKTWNAYERGTPDRDLFLSYKKKSDENCNLINIKLIIDQSACISRCKRKYYHKK